MTIKFIEDLLTINEPEWQISPFSFSKILKIGISGGSTPTWQDITISGNTALTLVNSKANGLNYLKLFGDCEQTGTPTPTVPVDIVCNNGTIKYSPNELNPSDIEIGYYRVQATGVLTESPYNFITGYMPVKPNRSYVFYGRRIEDNRLSSYNRIHWFNANKEFISTNSYTVNRIGAGIAPSNAYFAQCSCNESGATTSVTTQEIVDGYNWVFEQATAEVPYIPYVEGGLYTDGTTETVQVHSLNIFDKNSEIKSGWYAGANQTIVNSGANQTIAMRCKPNATYYFKHCTYQGGLRAFYTEVENWDIGSPCSSMKGKTVGDVNEVSSITVSGNAKWVFFIYGRSSGTEVTIEQQASDFIVSTSELTTSSTYEPYYSGGTATAQNLLAVGTVKDVQEVLTGAVTRNIGIKIFDGSENFSTTNATYTHAVSDRAASKTPLICSHFEYSTKTSSQVEDLKIIAFSSTNIGFRYDACEDTTEFKAWLKTQYDNGTPVIVVYTLATATTETVTGQHLTTQAGTNIIEITQASIDGLGLEVSYKGTQEE